MLRDPGGYRLLAFLSVAAFIAATYLHAAGIALSPLHVTANPRVVLRHLAQATPPRAMPARYFWLSRTFRPGDPRLVDVVAAGDVMMGSRDQGLNPDMRDTADISTLIGRDVVAIFRRADVAFVNLEGPLYDGEESSSKDCARCYAFRSPQPMQHCSRSWV